MARKLSTFTGTVIEEDQCVLNGVDLIALFKRMRFNIMDVYNACDGL